MIRPLTLAALLLAAAAPVAVTMPASAQDGPRGEERDGYDDRDRDEDRDRNEDRGRDRDRDENRGDRDRDRDDDRRGERRMDREDRREMRDRRDRDHDGPRMHHRGGMHGPGMRQTGASFRIEMGEGRSIVIRCGAEPLKACVEAAAPLLDMVEGAGGPMPPYGSALTGPATPPTPLLGGASGELPPPPAALTTPGDTPAPASAN